MGIWTSRLSPIFVEYRMRLGKAYSVGLLCWYKLKTTFSFASAEPFAIFVNHRMRVVFAMSVYYDCDMKNKPFDI